MRYLTWVVFDIQYENELQISAFKIHLHAAKLILETPN